MKKLFQYIYNINIEKLLIKRKYRINLTKFILIKTLTIFSR